MAKLVIILLYLLNRILLHKLFVKREKKFIINLIIGSFGLSTKEPYTVMNCPSCVVILHHHWHLGTPPPGTGLDIETSYLVHICTYVPNISTSNI